MAAQERFTEPAGRHKGGSSPDPSPAAPAAGPRLHLAYLDGLRALAASYVVAFHVVLGFSAESLTGPWRLLKRACAYGHEAVAVFIVLSGYCLMLPVVRAETPSFRLALGRFLRRRAVRILPPYFAALGLSLLALSTSLLARWPSGTIWDDTFPAFELGPIATHLLLVHNWFPAWTNRINGPLWSVASEWQIYFFLPLVLLPAWRRLGPWGALAVAAACSYAPLLISTAASSAANPWYLLLFAFGMLAAFAGTTSSQLATRLPWGSLSAASWLACVALSSALPSVWFTSKPLTDPLVGLATATLLVQLAPRASQKRGRLLALLEWGPLVALGNFSYSLYLTHLPVVAACYFALLPLELSPVGLCLTLLLVGGLASLAFAYAFHLLCERPFMQRR